jgi:hypothetical protein
LLQSFGIIRHGIRPPKIHACGLFAGESSAVVLG